MRVRDITILQPSGATKRATVLLRAGPMKQTQREDGD
jgi:hypothetical protein